MLFCVNILTLHNTIRSNGIINVAMEMKIIAIFSSTAIAIYVNLSGVVHVLLQAMSVNRKRGVVHTQCLWTIAPVTTAVPFIKTLQLLQSPST